MQKIDRRWFTATLSDRRISQRQLAKLMGVDPASIHRLLTGKRPMRMDEAVNIASLLGVPVADVLGHAGVNVSGSVASVPLVGFVDGQGEAHLDWNAQGERVPSPVELPPRACAVQMRTASSPIDSWDGWILYTTLPDGIAADALGRLCLVGLKGNGVDLLRFVRRGYRRGYYNLTSTAAPSLSDAELDWATPILHIQT